MSASINCTNGNCVSQDPYAWIIKNNKHNIRICHFCVHLGVKMRCGRCNYTYYCNLECQRKDWNIHKKECYPVKSELVNDKTCIALQEAIDCNLFREYQSICSYNRSTYYDQGRKFLYKGIIMMLEYDPYLGDHREELLSLDKDKDIEYWNNINTNIRMGGEFLCKVSFETLHDPFIWSFIPRRYHREIEYEWDGISDGINTWKN